MIEITDTGDIIDENSIKIAAIIFGVEQEEIKCRIADFLENF